MRSVEIWIKNKRNINYLLIYLFGCYNYHKEIKNYQKNKIMMKQAQLPAKITPQQIYTTFQKYGYESESMIN